MTDHPDTRTDWQCFLDGVPWLLQGVSAVEVHETRPANAEGIDSERFPILHRLVASATTTPVTLDDVQRELLTWSHPDDGERLSWLCAPAGAASPGAHPDHQVLLNGFGGVVERSSNEPPTWLVNCNDALTAREAAHDASFILDYAWMVEDHGGRWPIEPSDYYSICREANGNTTLCHRRTGEVLLFAADHAFDHIEVLEGCPPYSLYRIRDAPSFIEWVEEVARQWSPACGLR